MYCESDAAPILGFCNDPSLAIGTSPLSRTNALHVCPAFFETVRRGVVPFGTLVPHIPETLQCELTKLELPTPLRRGGMDIALALHSQHVDDCSQRQLLRTHDQFMNA